MSAFAFWSSIAIFLATYALIIWERFPRMVVAMAGGLSMILVGFLSQETAVREDVDFNTLGLLIGMMILVVITKRTGIFEAMAVWAARAARGEPLRLLGMLALITGGASAFLDNVTTVLLIVPVTFSLTGTLKVDPIPYLLAEVLASNIGGTATLIGDPPNIMIGSATGLGFVPFLANLALPAFLILLATIALLMFYYRKDLLVEEADRRKILSLDPREMIRDWAMLKKSLLVLGLTILGFVFHGLLHLESATIALTGAIILMLLDHEEPEEVLLAVEWPTIFFFVGLFVLVGGLKATGVIRELAQWSLHVTGGNLTATSMLVLWLSAIASAFIDNIPFVATMIPLIQDLGQISGMPLEPVWWSLALGACLGGNGTLIGASANVIVAGIAEKNGVLLSFRYFFKVAFPLMLLSIVISTVYVYLRYLL